MNHEFPEVFSSQGPRHIHLDFLRAVGLDRYLIDGYKLGADNLMESAKADATLFFPAAFLYRQYIELHLKWLLTCLRDLNVVPVTEKDLHGHELDRLWKQARNGLLTKWPSSGPEPVLDRAETIVMDFHEADPKGDEFRYALTKNGKTSLQNLPGSLNVVGIREAMEQLHALLKSCTDELFSELIDKWQRERDAEADNPESEL
jgi:hypothetical protein